MQANPVLLPFLGPDFVHGETVMLAFPKYCDNIGSILLSKIQLKALAIIYSLVRTKEPSPNHKNIPRPEVHKHI